MKQRVLVVGLAGVGKTAVINEFLKMASTEGVPVTHVNYGTVMMDVAKGMVKKRDEIRHLSTEAQKELQTKAAEAIYQKSKPKEVLLIDNQNRSRLSAWHTISCPKRH